MFVHLTKRTEFLVRFRLSIKRTNTNELPAEWFINCSLNVWFVCSPNNIVTNRAKHKINKTYLDFVLQDIYFLYNINNIRER
ncbi:hypothetical protein Hanom_Chr11g00983501 [Helianthus anomalus]